MATRTYPATFGSLVEVGDTVIVDGAHFYLQRMLGISKRVSCFLTPAGEYVALSHDLAYEGDFLHGMTRAQIQAMK